jgi:hypothetical protein
MRLNKPAVSQPIGAAPPILAIGENLLPAGAGDR